MKFFPCAVSKEQKTSALLSFISNMFRNNRGLSVREACFHSLLILDKSCTSEKRQNFRKEEVQDLVKCHVSLILYNNRH